MIEILLEKVEGLIMPFLEEKGAELVDIKIHRSGPTVNLQILVDKKQGSISLAECAELNRQIGDSLERENLISQHYIIEVSSPGLDRPLRSARDFTRVVGREVHLFFSETVEGKLEYQGLITQVTDDILTLNTQQGEITIPLVKINKGKQII